MTVAKNKLVSFWEGAKKNKEGRNAKRAAKSLQRQAEIDVAKAQETLESARTALDKAKIDAEDDAEKGFSNIVKAYMKVQVENKKFEDAVAIYEELFEEKPRLLD